MGLDAKLHGDSSMLLPDEKVQMGFVCGRDTMVFTTHRAMKIDKQGFTGTKVLYLSLPWTKIKRYEVESAGTWDLDAKMELTIKAPWYNREVGKGLTMDLARGRCDILALNAFISAQVIGAADGTSAVAREVLPEQSPGLIGEFFNWLGDDTHQVSAEAATSKVRVPRSMPAPMCTVRRLLAADVSASVRAPTVLHRPGDLAGGRNSGACVQVW